VKKIFFLGCIFLNRLIFAQSFFIPTTYVGAFGSSDWTVGWSNWTPKNTSYPAGTVTVQGDITSNTTWTANKTYLLKGYVYVKNNAVLTIEPGTIIRCDVLNATCLVITRGAKINAQGTETSPIVFTSNEAVGARTYGDWGGILILGKARINANGGTAEPGAGINNAKGDGLYGGTDDNDSSGIIRYLRIEFAGIQYQPDKEIPGFTLAAVGAKTDIDFVQISFSGKDALRLSGGAGRIKHLIIHRGYNSDITMDLGYRGLLQFGVILRDSAKSNASGTSAIEIQNDGLASSLTPNTDPTVSNFTVLGPLTSLTTPYSSGYRNALHIRRNGKCAFFNCAFAGFPRGIMLDGQGSAVFMKQNDIIIRNCTLAGNKIKALDTSGNVSAVLPAFDFNNWYKNAGFMNKIFTLPKDLKLLDPYNYNNPGFVPKSGSSLLTGAEFTHTRLNDTELKNSVFYIEKIKIIQQDKLLYFKLTSQNYSHQFLATIYNLNGQKLAQKSLDSDETFWDLENLKGINIVVITEKNGTIICSKKFVF
jgi:hypothetical protein